MRKSVQLSYAVRWSAVLPEIGLILILLLLYMSPAKAQLTTGTIRGTVTDQSGAAIPGSRITVKNVGTGIVRKTVSGPQGRYQVSDLLVGHYEVSSALTGFETLVRSGIELTVGRTAVVNLVLKVGAVTQSVTVTGEAPLVETTKATVSGLVNEKRVDDLPLNGRDLTQLTYLQPGVLRVVQAPGQNAIGGLGDKLSVNGARETENLYLLDGISESDQSGNAQGVSGEDMGAETVKEFQIITDNFSAQYKSAAGAVISAVTKSGTNSIHGSAFEYLRNSHLDAANFFDNADGTPKEVLKRNQFGGSLGGPIKRDKTFFFGSYEGLRERLNRTSSAVIPTAAARDGMLPGQTVQVSSAVKPYLQLWPIPGQGNAVVRDLGNGTVQVAGTSQQPTRDDFVDIRIDQHFSSGKAGFLSATYNYDKSTRNDIGAIVPSDLDVGSQSIRHILALHHTSVISPTVLNEFVFGYSYTSPEDGIPLPTQDFSNLAFVPSRSVIGNVDITGMARLGWRSGVGLFRQKELSFKDNLSIVRGKHSLKMGAELDRFHYDSRDLSRGYYGSWSFNSLADFLTATPSQFQAFTPESTSPNRSVNQLAPAFYFQDDYAVLPTLTLNLGLRYAFVTVPHETHGRVSSLVHLTDPAVTVGGSLYSNATLKSFSPRFGFAWAPGSQKTSVRGGFGIFYDFPRLNAIRTSLSSMPPFLVEGNITDVQAAAAGQTLNFPNAFTVNSSLLAGAPSARPIEVQQSDAYVMRENLTVQHQFGGGWVVSAGYTGSRGLHLWQQSEPDLNEWQGYPNQPTGPKFFPAGAPPINPSFAGNLRMQFANSNSWYNGLALSAQNRLSHGLQLQASFTYSKNIDQSSGVTSTGENLTSGQRGIYYWDMNLLKGLSSLDIRKSLVLNFSYQPSFGQGFTGIRGGLIHGWQMNGIFTASSGAPFSLLDPSHAQKNRIGSNHGLRPNLIPGGNNNPVLGGPTQYYDPSQFAPSTLGYFGTLGRNTVIGPGFVNFDFSLFKKFAVTEKSQLQFRAEFFNILNHTNFGTPDPNVFLSHGKPNPTAGQIVDTGNFASREIQFALRYTF